jgi:hypothetical protein
MQTAYSSGSRARVLLRVPCVEGYSEEYKLKDAEDGGIEESQ